MRNELPTYDGYLVINGSRKITILALLCFPTTTSLKRHDPKAVKKQHDAEKLIAAITVRKSLYHVESEARILLSKLARSSTLSSSAKTTSYLFMYSGKLASTC